MNDEINIITLGDIFKNIETEEKAFKFKDYIINLQQENKQLKEELKEHKKCIDEQNEELYRRFNSLDKATTLNNVFENILTELEEYLIKITKNGANIEKLTCSNILVYLKELKEKYK